MIRINLLPFRADAVRENIRRQFTVVFLVLILVSGGLFYYNLLLSGQIDELNGKISATRIALAAKKQQAAEVDRITKELEILKKKTEVIVNLALDRKEAVVLLDTMTRMVIDKRMWYTSLKSASGQVEVRGIALDNQTVADFMTRLEESPHFTDVRLQSTRRQAIGDLDNLKSFQITMRRLSLSEIARQEEEETEKGAKKS